MTVPAEKCRDSSLKSRFQTLTAGAMESTGDHVMCIHVIKIAEYTTVKCILRDTYVVYMSLVRFSELPFSLYFADFLLFGYAVVACTVIPFCTVFATQLRFSLLSEPKPVYAQVGQPDVDLPVSPSDGVLPSSTHEDGILR